MSDPLCVFFVSAAFVLCVYLLCYFVRAIIYTWWEIKYDIRIVYGEREEPEDEEPLNLGTSSEESILEAENQIHES